MCIFIYVYAYTYVYIYIYIYIYAPISSQMPSNHISFSAKSLGCFCCSMFVFLLWATGFHRAVGKPRFFECVPYGTLW